jgi:type IV secretion system protein VirB4
MRISEHRTKPQGLADVLLIDSIIEDGIALQQDGSLLAAWEFTGPDLESSEPAHLNTLVARLSAAMRLGTGWMIHCDVIRSAAPGYPEPSPFPDPVSELIDEERRQQFTSQGALYRSRYYLAITWLPPVAREERSVSWLVDGKSVHIDIVKLHLKRFTARVEQFENVFAQLVTARRLKAVRSTDAYGYEVVHDELLRYIHMCITGKDHPLMLPEIPSGLADILSSEDFAAGLEPRMGEKHIRVIAIDGFPRASRPGILAALDQLPLEYRWSTRAILLDPLHARSLLEKTRIRWRGLTRGFREQVMSSKNDSPDLHALDMMHDAQSAEAVAAAHEVQFCLYTSVVVVMDTDPSRLHESVRLVMSTVQNLGFACRLETVNAIESWLGSIPGDGYRNVRRQQHHTLNLADMLPLTSVWTGAETNPSRLMPPNSQPLMHAVTTGETPFRVNLHVSDLGHTLLVGPSGAGKSTALGLMAAQWFRYPKAQVFAFDWDHSIWLLTKALGGKHYDLMASEDLAFCPLQRIDTLQDQTWAAGWLEDLCRLNGMTVHPRESNAIVEAIGLLARNPKMRTLSDFVSTVQHEGVREALRYYTVSGALGHMLDADRDSLSLGGCRMAAFETKALMESRDPRASLPVLLYLFRRIEQRLDGSPTLLILDEAWAYLAHEIFRNRLEAWLRTMRRNNAAVVLATQQLSDIANSPIADTVFAQTATKILLPNAEASNPDSLEFYQRLGLNSREIGIVQQSLPKRDYYVISSVGRRLINLVMGQVTLSFTGVNAPPERKLAEQLMTKHPRNWQAEWLRQRGIDDWADCLDEQLTEGAKLCATV